MLAVSESQLWMFSHVDPPPIEVHLRLVFWLKIDFEPLSKDAVNVGCVCPMEEQHFLHFIFSVHLFTKLNIAKIAKLP